jgi:hypothetical protein
MCLEDAVEMVSAHPGGSRQIVEAKGFFGFFDRSVGSSDDRGMALRKAPF